jgi:hypothetical protein
MGYLGCDPIEGPLLVRQPLTEAGMDAQASAALSPIQPRMSLQYQLTGTIDVGEDAQVYVVDMFDARARDITELHAAGRLVIGYVSVGSLEAWREDADSFPASAIGMPLSGYPNEHWLDHRDPKVRAAMTARFELARSKGFDGIFASTLGAYARGSGLGLTRQDELDYVEYIATQARSHGLSPGLPGDFALATEVAAHYDWALSLGCLARGRCQELTVFKTMNKAVFDLESEGTRESVCASSQELDIPITRKHASYDAWRDSCN